MNLGLGYSEIIIIIIFALIVIGPKRLPELMRQMGKIMAQLRRASDDIRREILFSEEISEVKSTIRNAMDPTHIPEVPPRLKRKSGSAESASSPGPEPDEQIDLGPDEEKPPEEVPDE